MGNLTSEHPPDRQDQPAGLMFALSVLFLVLLSILLQRALRPDLNPLELPVLSALLGTLWLFFLADAGLRFLRRDRSRPLGKAVRQLVLVCLVPPLRLTLRPAERPDQVWLPYLGWRTVDYELRERLDRAFSLPMIVFALLVLPVLAVEYYWGEWLQQHAGLVLLLDLCLSAIWLAFTVEFLLKLSIAESKLHYCKDHWLDLAIILLPVVQALPFARALRLGRLLRLDQLSRMNQLYRLRGLAAKAWRALLLLDVLRRLLTLSPERRLRQLESQLAAKEVEVERLRKEIEKLRREAAQIKEGLHGRP